MFKNIVNVNNIEHNIHEKNRKSKDFSLERCSKKQFFALKIPLKCNIIILSLGIERENAVGKLIGVVLLYGATYTFAEHLSEQIGQAHLITAIFLPAFLLTLCIRLKAKKCFASMRLTLLADWKQTIILSLPLLALPILNLFLLQGALQKNAWELILLLSAAFAEELLFRGALPTILSKAVHNIYACLLTVNVLFALLHMAFPASDRVLILQILFALCVGLAFSALTERTGSILPAMVLHALINLTAGEGEIEDKHIIICLLASLLSCLYGVFLLHHRERGVQSK